MTMKRTSLLAWVLFGLLTCMAVFSLIYPSGANRETGQGIYPLAGDLLLGLLPIVFAFMAALILSKQPRNVTGWLLMLPGISLSLANERFLGAYYNSFTQAPMNPSAAFLLGFWFYAWSWLLVIFPVFLMMLVFPTGSPISKRWRWVTIYVLGVSLCFFVMIAFLQDIAPQNASFTLPNPIGFIPTAWYDKFLWAFYGIGLFSTAILSIASIFVRYRRAKAVEREQIKWLLYACGLFAGAYIGTLVQSLQSRRWEVTTIFYILIPLTLMTIPVAIGIAILRYRLWDIDVIIRRTLLYSVLTATLALVFFGGVTLLQSLFTAISEQQSAISIVVSTLVIAALFNPLRRRIQNGIDRRFYRRKYDAQNMLEDFAQTARGETDTEKLSVELTRVVQETLHPQSVTLWISPAKDKG
jgi:hypothetical protein